MSDSALNGILDIMRGISTIASVSVVGRTVFSCIEDLFKLECNQCNGMGKVTCTKCRGTKTLSKRPAQKLPNLQVFNRRNEDLRECFLCGYTTVYDFGLVEEDDQNEADRIKNTIRGAICNKAIPRKKPLAGTITCPVCRGQRLIWNIIPNFSYLFGIEEMWYIKPLRKGIQAYAPACWAQPHNKYIEWAGRPLRPITEREVGFFGEDVFDFEDQMFENTRNLMEEEKNEEADLYTSESTAKEPYLVENQHFNTVQKLDH
jgi:hypothetical protein